MHLSLTRLAIRATVTTAFLLSAVALAAAQEKLRFAVGPFQPTPGDTRKAYEPFFKHIADKLGRDYELVVTNDWAGIAIALANKQADVAWMGPWGYVLAHTEGASEAIATVKYNGKPTYHAIMVARPDLKIDKWRGLRYQRPFAELPWFDQMFICHDLESISKSTLTRERIKWDLDSPNH